MFNRTALARAGVAIAFTATGVVAVPTAAHAFGVGTYLVTADGIRPALSATGRHVAFVSTSSLAPNDTNGVADAYVKDLGTGVITLASVTTSGLAAGLVQEVDISDDGNRVAFLTQAPVLSPQGGYPEAYVRDIGGAQTFGASRGPTGAAADSNLMDISLSGDGSSVAFNTQATTLLDGDNNHQHDVYVKRVDTGDLVIASRRSDGVLGNGTSFNPSLSRDGRKVVFSSQATNLSAADPDSISDLYLKDLDAGALSVAPDEPNNVRDPSLSADGTRAGYSTSIPPFNSGGPTHVYDFALGTRTTVGRPDQPPCFTQGGRPQVSGSGTRLGAICGASVVLREVATGVIVVNRVASASQIAVSDDGDAFAYEDTGSSRSLYVVRLTPVDDTAPTVDYELAPATPDGDNGWYRGNVALAWTLTDSESAFTVVGCEDQNIVADQPATSYQCSATSDGGITGPVEVSVARDATPPTVASAISPTAPDGLSGWWVSSPIASFACDDATSGVAFCPEPASLVEGAASSVTATARDRAGNVTDVLAGPYRVDLTDPTVVCDDIATFLLNQSPAAVSAAVTDGTSGPVDSTATASVGTASPGAHTVVLAGSDIAGRMSTTTCDYVVAYGFSGFQSPVDEGQVNVARAGRTIPLKWRAVDASGDPVMTIDAVTVTVLGQSCDIGMTEDLIEETSTGSGLQNLGNGFYQYNWKTPASYAQSCKTMRLGLGDGVLHTAEFRFTK
jgi:Tol biopolymer transport system component